MGILEIDVILKHTLVFLSEMSIPCSLYDEFDIMWYHNYCVDFVKHFVGEKNIDDSLKDFLCKYI